MHTIHRSRDATTTDPPAAEEEQASKTVADEPPAQEQHHQQEEQQEEDKKDDEIFDWIVNIALDFTSPSEEEAAAALESVLDQEDQEDTLNFTDLYY